MVARRVVVDDIDDGALDCLARREGRNIGGIVAVGTLILVKTRVDCMGPVAVRAVRDTFIGENRLGRGGKAGHRSAGGGGRAGGSCCSGSAAGRCTGRSGSGAAFRCCLRGCFLLCGRFCLCGRGGGRRGVFRVVLGINIEENEAFAGYAEGLRGLALTHTDDHLSGLAKTLGEFVEITVA